MSRPSRTSRTGSKFSRRGCVLSDVEESAMVGRCWRSAAVIAMVGGSALRPGTGRSERADNVSIGFPASPSVAPLFRPRAVPCYPECPPLAPGTPVDPMNPTPVVPPGYAGSYESLRDRHRGWWLFKGEHSMSHSTATSRHLLLQERHRWNHFRATADRDRQEVRFIPVIDGPPRRVVVTVPVFGNVPVPNVREALDARAGSLQRHYHHRQRQPAAGRRFYFNYGYYDGMNAH